MTCTVVNLNGTTAMVCGPRRFRKCACGSGRPANLLCDWKVPGGTCSAKICSACSARPAPGKDLCPEHAGAWRVHPARGAFHG